MGRGFFDQINKLVKDVSQRTTDAVSRQQAALVRGKIAGRTVMDDQGNILVDAGHMIDDEAIERTAAAGKLSQLVVAAGTARVQDIREAAREQLDKSGAGREARSLDTLEEYTEARAYVGHYTGVDVTDIRGNVVIPTGRKLTEDDIRLARETGLLSALVFAAQQPYTPPAPPPEPPPTRGPFESADENADGVPQARRKLSLVDPIQRAAPAPGESKNAADPPQP
jgi:hypothetical protein